MDASNIIKPALSRGEMQCIGATTLNEYRRFIEKDAALERRFQSVMVPEPSIEESILILKGLRPKYEAHHKAKITDEAVVMAVELSSRYLTERFLPDKAIDVMDEAGARSRIQSMTRPPEIRAREAEIEEIKIKKEEAIRDQKFEEAAAFRDEERAAREKMDLEMAEWRKTLDETTVEITEDDIMHVVSKWTGVPLQKMNKAEMARLLDMEKELQKTVVGQDAAVHVISKALRRSRAQLKDPRRPIGSFVFLGATGIGKTLLAKALSDFMFDDPDALIQIDMSEYMEKFSSSRLVGSPPGYVGHEEGGQLTERVRRRPYSVVLFDEIEKAHPDVMHLLLQILEEGKLTDSLGRSVDFRNTIVIMTTNVGAQMASQGGGLGFSGTSESGDYDKMKAGVMKAAKDYFKPELVNRIDELIVFRQLNREDVEKILEIEMMKVASRLKARHIELNLSQEARDLLVEKGYDRKYGARPLRRAIERWLEDPLAEEILRGNIADDEVVNVTVEDGKLVFEQYAGTP